MWIGTQIGDALIGPSPGELTNRDKNIFFIFIKNIKHY